MSAVFKYRCRQQTFIVFIGISSLLHSLQTMLLATPWLCCVEEVWKQQIFLSKSESQIMSRGFGTEMVPAVVRNIYRETANGTLRFYFLVTVPSIFQATVVMLGVFGIDTGETKVRE